MNCLDLNLKSRSFILAAETVFDDSIQSFDFTVINIIDIRVACSFYVVGPADGWENFCRWIFNLECQWA